MAQSLPVETGQDDHLGVFASRSTASEAEPIKEQSVLPSMTNSATERPVNRNSRISCCPPSSDSALQPLDNLVLIVESFKILDCRRRYSCYRLKRDRELQPQV